MKLWIIFSNSERCILQQKKIFNVQTIALIIFGSNKFNHLNRTWISSRSSSRRLSELRILLRRLFQFLSMSFHWNGIKEEIKIPQKYFQKLPLQMKICPCIFFLFLDPSLKKSNFFLPFQLSTFNFCYQLELLQDFLEDVVSF